MNIFSDSSSSSDDFFDDMVANIIVYNELLEQEENLVIAKAIQAIQSCASQLVTSDDQSSPSERTRKKKKMKKKKKKKKKKRNYCERDREAAHQRLLQDYFIDRPLYPDSIFRRRFRMRRHVFMRIVNQLTARDLFFQQRPDATGRLGASPLQKCTTAMRMLAYGTIADELDGYLKISESTSRDSLSHFIDGVIAEFGDEYLRRPTLADLERLLYDGERRGFPGMMGSIDCMHWQWKNCPRGWKGQYQGENKVATVILEGVASCDLWIWHAVFGTLGSSNDMDVLYRSPVFYDIYQGRAPQVIYNVNGHTYNMGYYLTDEIYPKWAAFIPGISLPQTDEDVLFTERQKTVRKDAQRAFQMLQARFAIIQKPTLAWDVKILRNVLKACIILHNMIIEDERDTYHNYQDPTEFLQDMNENIAGSSRNANEPFIVQSGRLEDLDVNQYMERRNEVQDRQTHESLKNDLILHIWSNRHRWSRE